MELLLNFLNDKGLNIAKEHKINVVLNRMKPEFKLILRGLLFLAAALFFLIWGLDDILYLTGGSIELLTIIPVIAFLIFFLIMGILFAVSIIQKRKHVLYKKFYNCRTCGAVIKLEEIICAKCGAENTIRDEALEKLEGLERKIKVKRSENLKSSKWLKTRRTEKLQELDDELLSSKARKVRLKKTQLIIGTTHEGKLEWIKTQYYDLDRTIQDIADDLGESMIAVRKNLDEIENQNVI